MPKLNTYYHPKDLDKVTIECFISFLRDKRKLGNSTHLEWELESMLRKYLDQREENPIEENPVEVIDPYSHCIVIDEAIMIIESLDSEEKKKLTTENVKDLMRM